MKIAVCVSGGGTNLQAIIDAIDNGTITNTQIEVVISNNADAYALERAKKAGIKAGWIFMILFLYCFIISGGITTRKPASTTKST